MVEIIRNNRKRLIKLLPCHCEEDFSTEGRKIRRSNPSSKQRIASSPSTPFGRRRLLAMTSSTHNSTLGIPSRDSSFIKAFFNVWLAFPSLLFSVAVALAQPIRITLPRDPSALIQVDSANWSDAWIEVSGRDTSQKLVPNDLHITSAHRVAEVLSIDSIGAKYQSRLAVSFVLDNSNSMFHSYDTLTRLCDSILNELPPGVIGQAITFDHTYRSSSYLYTAHPSTFLAQSSPNGFMESRKSLSAFWHFFDTIRTQFTPLYDAIAAAITNLDDRRLHDTLNRNDVLIIVTDGGDNASRTSIETLEELLASAHLRFFAINYRVKEEGRLAWLTQKTGGKYFKADNLAALKATLRTIGRELTRQYHIHYRFPSLGPSSGESK